jgi:type II secretory pathway component HofQ
MQNIEANVVIGISVQEAIVESMHEENDGERVVTRSRSASVVARGPVQKQQSQKTLLGSRLKTIAWLSKAKTFTQKIRRKAKVAPPS